MASRVDGRKVVALAIAGMTGVCGISTIYLPFYSDRDAIRGIGEDENLTEEQKYEAMKEIRQQQQQLQRKQTGTSAGSMWKNMSQSQSRN
eukprot:CAMPEP_0178962388 /NCGR_PEP_ID=MMETSP0789-20121207/14331_1 /TAXON_ID=3005 /ORGANISM="Rhizosolenia setigera, Strain CCMP 1694" /LENGTH=89 /DNA_ID=CAMNT_0020646521 /DNA_START=71 /DNA_END=340 /DNA_ORIENTATION=+